MRIWFVHPDLGLGGAEMLVVNAALSLERRGHSVLLWTAHHDPQRCFSETKPGGPLGAAVRVHGDWLPRTVAGRLHVFCAVLRMTWISTVIAVWSAVGKGPDVIVCDQVSHVVPLLKWFSAPVVFYCHYPDKLLCVDRSSMLKRLYRAPFDWWEESSTGAADAVIVNSKFTASVFRESFTSLGATPTQVLYPSIDFSQFDKELSEQDRQKAVQGFPETLQQAIAAKNGCLLLSLNRFERKKNLALAIDALYELSKTMDAKAFENIHLAMAGGYDSRLEENVEYFAQLEDLVRKYALVNHVSFVRSFTDEQRLVLVRSARCVLYTPDKEHFGIVPIEAMYVGCPVVAVASGGPLESVLDGKTGFLVPQDAASFAGAVRKLVADPALAESMGRAGRESVAARFSLQAFGKGLDDILVDSARKFSPARSLRALLFLFAAVFLAISLFST